MAIYSTQTSDGQLTDILAVVANVGYLAMYRNENNDIVASHFPFWVIVDHGEHECQFLQFIIFLIILILCLQIMLVIVPNHNCQKIYL